MSVRAKRQNVRPIHGQQVGHELWVVVEPHRIGTGELLAEDFLVLPRQACRHGLQVERLHRLFRRT